MENTGEQKNEAMSRTTSELRRVFATFDENGDGLISRTELGALMKKLDDAGVPEEELTSMMESADKNGDGLVNFEEFVELHTRAESPELSQESDQDAEFLEAFQVFDKNNDGFISVVELQSILRSLGVDRKINIQDCEKIISTVDKNRDGLVDFAEFKRLMSGLPCTA